MKALTCACAFGKSEWVKDWICNHSEDEQFLYMLEQGKNVAKSYGHQEIVKYLEETYPEAFV